MKKNNLIVALFSIGLLVSSCDDDKDDTTTTTTTTETGDYSGTASVTQGLATTTNTNLFAQGGRVAGLGTISSSDNSSWTVPADVNFTNSQFPWASDLHNPHGNQYTTESAALAALDGTDIIEIDATGEVYTAYVFGDNYFELYINGVEVAKDPVPFTQFNSCIARFKANSGFTVAMMLVDWEENLGVGTESNSGFSQHPGDGGMVAVIKDASNNIVAITNSDWKAQTFYTAPIKDLSCPTESGTTRSSANCDESDSNVDPSTLYGLHWDIPSNWTLASYDDSSWPSATTYTNATIGVDNKTAYTSFTDIFDNSTKDAQFIWSTNVVLDNLVVVRYTVQ